MISTLSNRKEYVGDGAIVGFLYNFRIDSDADLKVYSNNILQTLNVHYTVSGVGSDSGGTVTFVAAPASGHSVILLRVPAFLQALNLIGFNYAAESHEDQFDKTMMLLQRLEEMFERSITLPEGDTPRNKTLDIPGAGEYLRWKNDGSGIEGTAAVFDLGNFLASGGGAVSRTAASKMGDIVSVRDFGAVGDGATDDTTAIRDAIAAVPNGGTVLFPGTPTSYKIGVGNIILPTAKSIRLLGADVKIVHDNPAIDEYVFGINMGNSPTAPRHTIQGFRFDKEPGDEGKGIAIRIWGSNNQIIRDCSVYNFDKGIAIRNEAAGVRSEGNSFENLWLSDNNYGIHISQSAGGNASIAGTKFRGVVISAITTTAATAYCFYLDTGASLYRSVFDMILFPSKNNSVAFWCDGDMRNASGGIHVENTDGGVSGNKGFHFGTNAGILRFNIFFDIRGTITTSITFDSAATVLTGLRTNSLLLENAFVHHAGTLAILESVASEDLVTTYWEQVITAANLIQFRGSTALPPEFIDKATGKLLPTRLLDIGTAPVTAPNLDTSPSVLGVTYLKLSNSAATDVSTFDDGIEGQTLLVEHVNQNTTIKAGPSMLLAASPADYTPPTALGGMQTFQYVGSEWHETARINR